MINDKLYLRIGKNDKSGVIYVTFYINREKVHFSTKVECTLKNWSEKTMQVKMSDPDWSDKNTILKNIRGRISNVDVKYRLKDRKMTKDLFLRNYHRPDDFDTFHQFCDDYQKQTRRRIGVNTKRMHDSVLKKLKEFAPDLYFDQIDKDWLEDYVVHLKKDLKNNDNTAHKNLAVLRKFILAAIRAGYMETNPFADFSVKQSKPNIVFLEEAELKLMYKKYNEGNIDEKYIPTFQLFLFMCFGGQHVGDAKAMTLEQFTKVNYSYYRMKLMGVKPQLVTVPLSVPLKKIVADIVGDRKNGLIFEKLPADQTMNEYLKKIADYCGVKKSITHKTGRHTFATIFLEYNPNPRTLQDILGHSSINQTMTYVHALARTKQRGIQCFDKF
jgi:site-specific recombinase XerD